MAHFAEINTDNIVTQVIVVDNNDILDDQGNELESIGTQLCTNLFGGTWVQTSYNTHSNQYFDSETGEIGSGTPLRKNYAGVGYTYDSVRDAFIPPQPYPSWILNEDTCQWDSPVPYPADDLMYSWDEDTTSWVETEE